MIVLVVLSLFHSVIGERRAVYRWALDFTLAFAVVDALNAAGFQLTVLNNVLSQYVPFYSLMLGWLLPALIGAGIGLAISLAKGEAAALESDNSAVDAN